jgi:hypothetical protein
MSILHLLKHALKLFRFALIGYRFQTLLLPLFKTHLWLHYFYPLATIMEVYPSFIEPKAIALDLGGASAFFRLSYRLLRLLRTTAGPSFLYNSHGYTKMSNDSITEASHFTLNLEPSMGVMNNGASDLNYGFGGYWGFDQTSNLIGKFNNVRPYLQTLEAPNFYNYPDHLPAFYRAVYPHPTAPLVPPLEKPINVFFDKIFPRTNEYFEAMRIVGSDLSNLSCENTPIFYKAFKSSGPHRTSPSKWDGGFSNKQSEVRSFMSLGREQSYLQQAAIIRQDPNRKSRTPSVDLHGGFDNITIKTSNLLNKGWSGKAGRPCYSPRPNRCDAFFVTPDKYLNLWGNSLRLPFETERVLAVMQPRAGAGPLGTLRPDYAYPKYPLSLENYKNNSRGLNSIMIERRRSCNHYRHILEPSDLKLRKIPDSSDPNFSLTKEPDFLNLFNRPIDDHLETWGFLYNYVIFKNKTAWDWGLNFPYH